MSSTAARSLLAATVVAICGVGCTAASPTAPEAPAPTTTVAVLASPSSSGMPSELEQPAPKPLPGSCETAMFDAPPGHHDRFAFEGANGSFGFRDATGQVVIAPRFVYAYEFSPEGVAAAIEPGGRPVFIDTSGKVLAQAFLYDNGPDYFSDGRARIVDGPGPGRKMGFIDERGRVVLEPSYSYVGAFCHRRALVCRGCQPMREEGHTIMQGGRWGLIDWSGSEIVPPRYDEVEAFDGEKVIFKSDGERVVLDRQGRPVK